MVFNATLAFQSSPKSSHSNSTAPPLLSLQTSSQSLDPFPTKMHTDQSHIVSLPHAFMSQAFPSCLTPEIKTPSLSALVPDSGAPVPNLQRDLAVACSPCMRWDFRRDGAGGRVSAPPQHPPILLQLQNHDAVVRHEEIHLADLAESKLRDQAL
jgi:hypothetical protein